MRWNSSKLGHVVVGLGEPHKCPPRPDEGIFVKEITLPLNPCRFQNLTITLDL